MEGQGPAQPGATLPSPDLAQQSSVSPALGQSSTPLGQGPLQGPPVKASLISAYFPSSAGKPLSGGGRGICAQGVVVHLSSMLTDHSSASCSTIRLLLVPVRYYGTAPCSLTRPACPARRRARQAVCAVKSCCPGRCSQAAAGGRPRLSGVCDPRSAERCRGGCLVRVMVPCRANMTMKGT